MALFALSLLSSSVVANAQVFADDPCDPLYYESLEARAWLEAQREITKAEQNSQWFGGFGVGIFSGFNKQQKIEAIDKLVELLNKIYLHKPVDPAGVEAISQNPIYKDGRLKDKVKLLNQLGIDDISQLADLVDNYDVPNKEQVKQSTDEIVQPSI